MTDLGMPGRRLADRPGGATGLIDHFGRVATDLRISVTDRCNLRCTYCMPAEGLPWLPTEQLLSDDELVRLADIFVGLGVRTIRLTGGEPLLRRGLVGLVERLAGLEPRPSIALTTNGVSLARLAGPLKAAGLDRVNVSLDSVDPHIFSELTLRDRLGDVEKGLAAAAEAGLTPTKVNTVAMRGINDHVLVELVRWCLARGYEPRFIEQMPLDPQQQWDAGLMVSAAEVKAALSHVFDLQPLPARGSAPAERFLVDGGPATVGIIASVSDAFCSACDRVRLTADGQVRNCLFSDSETDLRAPLRAGASDAELAELIRAEMWAKKRGHGIGDPDFVQPSRPMSAIGG